MKFDLSDIKFSKYDVTRNIKLPEKLTPELAEFLGIMVGDGHIGLYTLLNKKGNKRLQSEIKISGNLKEENYIFYIRDLIESLFNVRFTYYKDTAQNAVILALCSKGIVQFLNKKCNLPTNRKVDSVVIPKIIMNSDKKIKSSFLRGLADTDFTVTFKNRTGKGHNYPLIKANFKSKMLIKDLEILFSDLGYKFSTYYNDKMYDKRFGYSIIHNIYLYGRNNLNKWIKEIGFSNHKFNRKIEKWKKDGICPPGYE